MGRKMIDGDLLYQLFQREAEDKLRKEIHEWIIYTAPPEVLKIYKEYIDTMAAHEIKIDE